MSVIYLRVNALAGVNTSAEIKMKSKTKISKQLERKKNPLIVQTIIEAKKNDKWLDVAGMLSGPSKKRITLNLSDVDKIAEEGETIVIPGKILSQGDINKKIKVVLLSCSNKAKEKLMKANCEISSILEEIKKNPKAGGLKIIK